MKIFYFFLIIIKLLNIHTKDSRNIIEVLRIVTSNLAMTQFESSSEISAIFDGTGYLLKIPQLLIKTIDYTNDYTNTQAIESINIIITLEGNINLYQNKTITNTTITPKIIPKTFEVKYLHKQ